MVVYFVVVLKPFQSLTKVIAGWGKRCERNNVMVHVGVLLEPFGSTESICLARGSGANATMRWIMLVYCSKLLGPFWMIQITLSGWWKRCEHNDVMGYVGALLESLESDKSIYLGVGSGVTATMCWNSYGMCCCKAKATSIIYINVFGWR